MMIPTGGVDKALGIHLQRVYKTNPTSSTERASRSDAVTISKLSALVERGRTSAMALPELRADRVAQVRFSMAADGLPGGGDLASALINRAVEGTV